MQGIVANSCNKVRILLLPVRCCQNTEKVVDRTFSAHLVIISGNSVICSINAGVDAFERIEDFPCRVHVCLRSFEIAIKEFCVSNGSKEENMGFRRFFLVDAREQGS